MVVLAAPAHAALALMGVVVSRETHLVVSQAGDCADALRLARRRLAKEFGRGEAPFALVILSDSAVSVDDGGQDATILVSGIGRNLFARWLVLRGEHRSPVLISRFSPLRDRLQWLDPE